MGDKDLKILIEGKRIKTLEEAANILGVTFEYLLMKLVSCEGNFYTGAIRSQTVQIWNKYRMFTDIEEEEDIIRGSVMDQIYEEFLEYQKNKELLDSQK